jgi:hypothetical protein
MPRRLFNIKGATGTVQEFCYLVDLEIAIGNWSGSVQFVLSSRVKKHKMVLGRDFLKKRKVVVDHSTDELVVEGVRINSIHVEKSEIKDSTMSMESPPAEKKVCLEWPKDHIGPLSDIMPDTSAKTVGQSYLCEEFEIKPNSQMLANVEFTNFRTEMEY